MLQIRCHLQAHPNMMPAQIKAWLCSTLKCNGMSVQESKHCASVALGAQDVSVW